MATRKWKQGQTLQCPQENGKKDKQWLTKRYT
jgi:hypothetical protein